MLAERRRAQRHRLAEPPHAGAERIARPRRDDLHPRRRIAAEQRLGAAHGVQIGREGRGGGGAQGRGRPTLHSDIRSAR
jgi:hypothetical protein